MITFQQLGSFGRLGNQMFQIAAVLGHAIKHNVQAVFPKWEYDPWFNGKLNQTLSSAAIKKHYRERGFPFQNIPQLDGLSISGYFQSEKYFEHCQEQIRSVFSPSRQVSKVLTTKYADWLSHPATCSIHVRRGDYLKLQEYHPLQPLNYYQSCMHELQDIQPQYLVFSDDIGWCKQTFKGSQFHFIEGEKDVIDLQLMARCKHHIIANSSFSWWGAWLNPSIEKRVFAPANWFGPAARHHDTRDLLPSSWIKK